MRRSSRPPVGGAVSTGRFIVLEGVEGAGKSEQIRRLTAWLEELGLEAVVAREPGGTPVGEAIREVVLARRDLVLPPETELLLMLAARAAFVEQLVRPALEEGRVVVADRFDLSTFAYQGYGRGLDLDRVRAMNAWATGGLVPDLYLVLDLPVEEGLRRQDAGGKDPDRIERDGAAFLERVRAGYLALLDSEERTRRIDARGTAAEVHDRVRAALVGAFPETFGPPTG